VHNRPKTERTFGIPERNQYNKSRSLLARDVPIILVEEKGHKDGSEFQVGLSRRQCNERTGLIVENRCQIGASLPLDVQCVAMCLLQCVRRLPPRRIPFLLKPTQLERFRHGFSLKFSSCVKHLECGRAILVCHRKIGRKHRLYPHCYSPCVQRVNFGSRVW